MSFPKDNLIALGKAIKANPSMQPQPGEEVFPPIIKKGGKSGKICSVDIVGNILRPESSKGIHYSEF